MEKKGEYENPGFEFLKSASERELFYLNSGLTISGARELLVQINNMEENSLKYYTKDSDNELLKWFENMFKDKNLAISLKNKKSKDQIIKTVKERLSELQAIKLKKFSIIMQKDKLLNAEEYIFNNLSKGVPYYSIRDSLIANGWSSKVVDLILESDTYHYRNYTSIYNIFEINAAYEKFEGLKNKIITGIAEGLPLVEITDYLKNLGWSNQILNYLLNAIYKPNKTITKLYWYIIKEVGDNKKNLSEVKATIIKSGWSSYIVDHLIHRFNTFDDELYLLLNHLKSFDSEEKTRVTTFLKSQGWDEALITRAINNRETKTFWTKIAETLTLENDNSLKFNTELFKTNILRFKNTTSSKEFWDNIIKEYKRVNLQDFISEEDELHLEKDYIYYYSKKEIQHLLDITKKGMFSKLFKNSGTYFYYSSPIKPMLCDLNKNKFLVAPHIIHRDCISCKIKFPINKMTKIEMWDASRTHKVTNYVCKQHETVIQTLMDENKFVQ